MRIHILGICGTFMGGIALIARALGHEVSGSDTNVYPPMSTLLEEQGITLDDGYRVEHLDPRPDLVIVGNTMSRGNEVVEFLLADRLPFCSGPEWLCDHVLRQRHVLAVSGTHGKTTTTSMLAWLLESAGLNPGFLIGGVAGNFNISARLGGGEYFVIEADEYDTAFFDKRSKFVHYFPDTLVINNLEFDHADIFPDLQAIKTQFRHLLRIVPENGLVIVNGADTNIREILDQGVWSQTSTFSVDTGDWHLGEAASDYSCFTVIRDDHEAGVVEWPLFGRHNAENALAAIAAASHVGIDPAASIRALRDFINVKRRLQVIGEVNGITVYDDFAHHPTAISASLTALRERVGDAVIHAVLEPRSNTMKAGVHRHSLVPAMDKADYCYLYQSPDVSWNMADDLDRGDDTRQVFTATDEIIDALVLRCQAGAHILIMSNGGFENIHQRLLQRLQQH